MPSNKGYDDFKPMKTCDCENPEECREYKPKCEKPGRVNLDCINLRKGFLGKGKNGEICTAPWALREQQKEE